MSLPLQTKVYLAVGSTDMRKSINGLSILVEDVMEIDQRELSWLLEGLDLGEIRAHEKLSYATLL